MASHSPEKSRRGFLKLGALLGTSLGTFAGLGSFGRRALAANQISSPAVDLKFWSSQQEPAPITNLGPTFLRRTFSRPRPTGKIPILQGATSGTETQFRILVSSNVVHRYFVVDGLGGGRREISPRARNGGPTSQKVIDHVFVSGLEPGTLYSLEIEVTSPKPFVERRQFSTMSGSKATKPEPLRVALISCQNDRYVDDQADMWEAVAKSAPELLIFNGDSCYVDQRSEGTVEGMWKRHITTREMLDVFKWDRLVPTLTTWDDHDTGENDSNSFNPYLRQAREYFLAMFGSESVAGFTAPNFETSGTKPLSDFYSSYDINGLRFILLDGRTSKTPDRIFSSDQEAWIEKEVLESPGPVWLVNGMQFWGGYLLGAESVEHTAPDQLHSLMKLGAKAKVPMVLCSGDVHFSELMELESSLMGYRTYELTSSALHSRTFPGQQYRSYNSRRFESTWRNNFIALEIEATSSTSVEFEAVSMGSFEKEFFRFKGQVKR